MHSVLDFEVHAIVKRRDAADGLVLLSHPTAPMVPTMSPPLLSPISTMSTMPPMSATSDTSLRPTTPPCGLIQAVPQPHSLQRDVYRPIANHLFQISFGRRI